MVAGGGGVPKHATLHLSRDVQSLARLSLGSMLRARMNWFGEMTHHLLHIDIVSSLSLRKVHNHFGFSFLCSDTAASAIACDAEPALGCGASINRPLDPDTICFSICV